MNREPVPRVGRISVARFAAVLCLSLVGGLSFYAAEQDAIEFSKSTPMVSSIELMKLGEEVAAELLVAAVSLGAAVRVATDPDRR